MVEGMGDAGKITELGYPFLPALYFPLFYPTVSQAKFKTLPLSAALYQERAVLSTSLLLSLTEEKKEKTNHSFMVLNHPAPSGKHPIS